MSETDVLFLHSVRSSLNFADESPQMWHKGNVRRAGCQQHLLPAAQTKICKHVGVSVFACLVPAE